CQGSAERLVGTLGFEDAAVLRQELAQLAPAGGVGRRELHQDAELAHGFVDAAKALERPGAQPTRRAPGAMFGAQLLRDRESAAQIRRRELLLRSRQLGAFGVAGGGLRPVLAGAQLLFGSDAIEYLGDPALEGC